MIKSNNAMAEDMHANSSEPEIVQEYKNLNDKCDAVLEKINKRKKNTKTVKKSKK